MSKFHHLVICCIDIWVWALRCGKTSVFFVIVGEFSIRVGHHEVGQPVLTGNDSTLSDWTLRVPENTLFNERVCVWLIGASRWAPWAQGRPLQRGARNRLVPPGEGRFGHTLNVKCTFASQVSTCAADERKLLSTGLTDAFSGISPTILHCKQKHCLLTVTKNRKNYYWYLTLLVVS